MMQQGINDLTVAELEQALPAVHHGHTDTKSREHDGVLDSNHTAANNDHGARDLLELQDFITGEDLLSVKRNVRRPRGLRARSQQEVLRSQTRFLGIGPNFDGANPMKATPVVFSCSSTISRSFRVTWSSFRCSVSIVMCRLWRY